MHKAERNFLNDTEDWLRLFFNMEFVDLNQAKYFSIIKAESHALEACWSRKSPQETALDLKEAYDGNEAAVAGTNQAVPGCRY